jgi:cellobiose phosphorylase
MKLNLIPSAHELITNMKAFFQLSSDTARSAPEEPLREELFSSDQLDRFGKALAGKHALGKKPAKDHLLRRLADNETLLQEARKLLNDSIKRKYPITPAGEWLIDNFYLIEEHIRIAKTHFPKTYSEDLPQLSAGPAAGVTRVYDLVLQIISHSDGKLDMESLNRFIQAYQSITNLHLGELWAVPIMLRLALIENIRRVSARMAIDKVDRNLADYWAKKMIGITEKDPKSLILVIADMARSEPPFVSAFVSEFIRQLMGKGPGLAMAVNWIEEQLSDTGRTGAELVNAENKKQTADQVSISNCIGSLRLLGALDWRHFVETNSIVEQTLRQDNEGVYGLMDFPTRDRYRHVVELIARKSPSSEQDIAMIAIRLTKQPTAPHDGDERTTHVGYYLIGPGLRQTQRLAKMRLSLTQRIRNAFGKYAFGLYLTSVLLISLAVTAAFLQRAHSDTSNAWLLTGIALLLLISSSQLALAVVNFFSTLLVRPDLLPRMDFSREISPDCRTLVVVPAMLTTTAAIEELVEALEVRFLANRNAHLHFGLLTDFTDAALETLPEDPFLLDTARQGIARLNSKYPQGQGASFFLFHRPRKWNPAEGVWMGYERKRGKLSDLNALLRGDVQGRFSLVTGDQSLFPEIKYVITLDADTQLPLGSAWKLIGTMAHPLNRAWIDKEKKRVTRGYGILQPRITISLPDITGSLYTRMHGNEPGIDPYTRASSDVYQDLFAEGSYIGKGIYEVDTFLQVLNGQFLENRILSHDLLEGCYIRSGLVSDVQLFEKYPTTYSDDIKMRLRWTRGDWQIFSFFLPIVPSPGGKWRKNPISGLSRWKIFDNLRQSLVPIALTVLLLLGWLALPSSLFWTMAVSVIIVFPIAIQSLWNAIRKPKDVVLEHHLRNSVHNAGDIAVKTLFTLVCLPFQAFSNLLAIVRTSWRVLVTRKHLLQWTASAHTNIHARNSLSASYSFMWAETFLASSVFIVILLYFPIKALVAGPILLLWLVAPYITWLISRPLKEQGARLTTDQRAFLFKLARKTWSFFEQFVVAEENWLPPDNFQEQPMEQIAHRTSPTNIGLSLLANVTAFGFGYLSSRQMVERTARTIDVMEKMERYKGHFYNWYDTQTLSPLVPKYISTVDSGNLAGHLLVLKQGLLALSHQPVMGKSLFLGLRDTLGVLTDTLKKQEPGLLEQFTLTLDLACNSASVDRAAVSKYQELLSGQFATAMPKLPADPSGETHRWAQLLATQLQHLDDDASPFSPGEIVEIERLADRCDALADMQWDFLYNRSSHLFTIGYDAQEHLADASFYDLLASEARLCIFTCIAQGKLPEESWFALGRLLTNVDGNPILLSWSGSMFEYLMPLLVMPTYENTLLGQSCTSAVAWQIVYGKKTNKPWGISESGYNSISANSNYLYRAFGAPGLGLKRGLEEDSVIAPYATALALMVAPEKACKNLELLGKKGLEGRYGFYESIDYTPSRLQRGQSSAIVYSFMAHHHGMSLLSLAYLLLDKPLQKLFEAEPQFKAALLLLQERIPRATTFFRHTTDIADINYAAGSTETRVIDTPDTPLPEVQLLSNGRYHVMVTNAGGGYSVWKDLAVTRWQEDGTCDNRGSFCYIRDLDNNAFWSNTHQPSLKKAAKYEAAFSQGRVDFRTANNGIETHTEIVVSPEDDIEMRRVRITNRSTTNRTLEVTSYAEVVLAPAASDLMQPAFSNLFVQTEIIHPQNAILCTRRPRSSGDQLPWMFHLMTVDGKSTEGISYETDRMAFIGRGNTLVNPRAMHRAGPLSGSQGSVLDPIVAIRYKITLDPEEVITIDMVTGVAGTKAGCQGLIDKYQDNKPHKDRVFEMAWTHSQVLLRQINASEADAQLYGRLAGSILFANAAFRADPAVLISNHRGQSGLWGYSISGDLPIVLLKVEKQANMQLVQQLIQAHTYWRLKGIAVDLVIWNEEHNGYRQDFQNDIQALIAGETRDRPGGIFVRGLEQISGEDRLLFQTVARVIISDSGGTLADHVNRKQLPRAVVPPIVPSRSYDPSANGIPSPDNLTFFNGLGGYSPDGSEYIIVTDENNKTPAPWVNVIANPVFGTVISESGTAYTWTENAHELRLTPWNNDPVSDTGGEAFYLRDEETAHFWSPSPLPAGGRSNYITRHGFGYSGFEHIEDGIYSEMLVWVDRTAAIKFIQLNIRNGDTRTRKLSVTGYIEWVLGSARSKTAPYIHTEIDPDSGAFFASDPYNAEFSGRVAFFDTDHLKKTFTADRIEFIGRNANLQHPEALSRRNLSGRVGLALDPCAALQVPFDLAAGEDLEIIFRLGAATSHTAASTLARQFRGSISAHESLEKVKSFWKQTVGAIRIETPDAALDSITNGWLTYQTLSCRLWGRSGFYQSGGAFGFRDQLQDVLSLLYADPALTRTQILLSASRQFQEGDVQHWWHPPLGSGVRTRISDDFLWLPFVTARYIRHTGDTGILDEPVHFIEGRALNPEEESYYDRPATSAETASLYEHCTRAIRHGFRYGGHGLPLIGTGDWNDGYDKVGSLGQGESVWLAFFLYDILDRFTAIAQNHRDPAFAAECKVQARQLKENIELHAWDGDRYIRAWFDDGTPLGSETDEECKIDSIAQSWAVISGAGDPGRTVVAMETAYELLVKQETGIIRLLTPAFDKSALNPGYIKGYVPGIRENGGQYTHAAVWMIIAFARLGNNKRVWELLQMINPLNHGLTAGGVATYKVEPYVLAADVYSLAPHAGRGGWTWYTGSAGWLYRLIIESFLGLRQVENQLTFAPCIPEGWDSFKIHYRWKNTLYHITILQNGGSEQTGIVIDGTQQEEKTITLTDDGADHQVIITLSKKSANEQMRIMH